MGTRSSGGFATTRIIDGDRFKYYDGPVGKRRATEVAKQIRDKGHKARLIKYDDGYFVFIRG